MKKYNILILALLLQILFIGSVQAKCDLGTFRFGTSYNALVSKLNLDEEFMQDKTKGVSEQFVSAPGEEVCKNEKALKNSSIHFLFLYDKLVEIKIMTLSETPILFAWAESIYGVKENKPNSFYGAQPIAHWLWETSSAVISYSVESMSSEVVELIGVQSINHQKSFARFAIEQEGGK